jgi:SAM-dependent methyltransferase
MNRQAHAVIDMSSRQLKALKIERLLGLSPRAEPLPLLEIARRADQVVGVDISPAMLAEARRNVTEAGACEVELVESDDRQSCIHGQFGLVHSNIVLQHIPWKRGRHIVAALADCVAPCGVLAVQLLSGYWGSLLLRGLVQLRYAFPPANWLRNLLRGRPIFEPAMQLHVHDPSSVWWRTGSNAHRWRGDWTDSAAPFSMRAARPDRMRGGIR